MQTGWITQSDAEYFSAYAINSTYLSEIYNWQRYIEFEVATPTLNDNLLLGTAIHLRVLQPQLFDKLVKRLPEDLRTKEGKQAYEDLRKMQKNTPDIVLLKPYLYDYAIKAGDKALENAEVRELLSGCIFENVGYQEIKIKADPAKKLPRFLKAKIDARRPGLIVELKTTSAKNIWEFQKAVDAYNYDQQAAFYPFLANSIERSYNSGISYDKFKWILITKPTAQRDYEIFEPTVICYSLSPEDMKIGRHKWETAYLILKKFYESGEVADELKTPDYKLKRFNYLFS